MYITNNFNRISNLDTGQFANLRIEEDKMKLEFESYRPIFSPWDNFS